MTYKPEDHCLPSTRQPSTVMLSGCNRDMRPLLSVLITSAAKMGMQMLWCLTNHSIFLGQTVAALRMNQYIFQMQQGLLCWILDYQIVPNKTITHGDWPQGGTVCYLLTEKVFNLANTFAFSPKVEPQQIILMERFTLRQLLAWYFCKNFLWKKNNHQMSL